MNYVFQDPEKNLKRKKTMNIILLLFVILCSMVAAASVNNIIAVTGGIEHYFNKAGMPEIVATVRGENDFGEKAAKLSAVSEIKTEHYSEIPNSKSFRHNGEKLTNFINPAQLISDSNMALNYFDQDNNTIKNVQKGTFYATTPFTDNTDIKDGDEVTIELENTKLTLKYSGYFKGTFFSTEQNSGPYLILNAEDYNALSNQSGNTFSLFGNKKTVYQYK